MATITTLQYPINKFNNNKIQDRKGMARVDKKKIVIFEDKQVQR